MHRIAAVVAGLSLAFVGTSTTFAATINVPGDQPTIAAAISASVNGDVIAIAAGTYLEGSTIDTDGKGVTIRGAVDGVTGEPLSILDGDGLTQVLLCNSGETETTIFENLVIQNGYTADDGGGAACIGTSPSFVNCVFKNNTTDDDGGAVAVLDGASPLFAQCSFIENYCGDVGGGLYAYNASVTVRQSLISENQGMYTTGGSVGASSDATIILEDCEVCGNSPNQYWEYGTGQVVLVGTTCVDEFCGTDSDSDGTVDCDDNCPDDPLKTEPGVCGCGTPDVDSDSDGVLDCNDAFPNDPNESIDSDGDGVGDNSDPCPTWTGDCFGDETILVTATNQSIQDAITAVSPGGVIEIIEGTFMITNTINTGGKALTIRGAVDAGTGEPLTILDGGGATVDGRRVLSCDSGETGTTVFENLVIQNGYSVHGQGTWVHGAGMAIYDSSPKLINCIFKDNWARHGYGGGMYFENSYSILEGCVFIGNRATEGGGVYNREGAPTLRDCVISMNSLCNANGEPADLLHGGGIYVNSYSSIGLVDCVVCENRPNQIWEDGNGGATLWDTCVEYYCGANDCGDCTDDADSDGICDQWDQCPGYDDNIDSDGDGTADECDSCPNDYDNDADGDGLCSDVDNCPYTYNDDQNDGDGDGIGDLCDQCPGEDDALDTDGDLVADCLDAFPSDPNEWADIDGDGVGDNADPIWTLSPGDSIQEAITNAYNGIVIDLAAGTYYEYSLNPDGKAFTIQGTLNGDGTLATTIDAQQGGSVFVMNSGEGDGTVIKDLVITGGSADNGGGIYCSQSNPTISGCSITGNTATYGDGGGIYCWESSPTISGCTISGNTAQFHGGGIYCRNSNPTITNCTIEGNTSNHYAGGIYCENGSPTITGCMIQGNTAESHGGGITCRNCNPTITGCMIQGNTADNGGGISCLFSSNPTITGCAICGNAPDQIYGSHTDSESCIEQSCDPCNADSDDDGVPDFMDQCPGYDDHADADGDGTADGCDNCPDDPLKTEPGGCGCGELETDTDLDGTPDCIDGCPDDPLKTEPGMCGCGTAETNVNGDVDCDGDYDIDDIYAGMDSFGIDNGPTGACCVSSGCDATTEESCANLGGTWLGEDSSCDDCTATCQGDANADGVVDVFDLLKVIDGWGVCP